MSFAAVIKKELTGIDTDPCCRYAEISALIRMNGTVSVTKDRFTLDVQTENAAIARRIYSLIKAIYAYPIEVLVRKKMKLKKNNVYIIRLVKEVRTFLQELEILDENNEAINTISPRLLKKTCCKNAYLRGAFLASGSINNPETSSYHLEIYNANQEHNESLCELLNSFELRARTLDRRNGFITYIKEAEKITEFLIIIGAHTALFKFEDVRIVRDMRNSVNRLVNCETANLNKTISAAFRQVESIKLIKETVGLDALPERLQEIAHVRLANREATLGELAELMVQEKISKSGINHRLRKIDELAEKLRRGEKIT